MVRYAGRREATHPTRGSVCHQKHHHRAPQHAAPPRGLAKNHELPPPSARSSFQGSRPVSARSDRSTAQGASFSFRKGSFTDKPGDMKDAERPARP